jgi:anti-sigma regulatory factor (Ser/Thr protein kinase)
MITQIVDYRIFAEQLLTQWKDSTKLRGIIEASLDQASKIEEAGFEIRDLMDLDTATGEALDFIGGVWNVHRDGRTDAEYRPVIRLQKTSTFSGEPEAVIEALKASYGATFVVYSPEYPGKYRMRSDAIVKNGEIETISSAGVGFFLAGRIVDAVGNPIVDAVGNQIIHILNEN